MTRSLSYLWYPVFMGAAIAAFLTLIANGVTPPLAAYLPITLVGFSIIVLEWRFPQRMDWRPRWADVKADAAFMSVVQVVLARLLALLGVFALAGWAQAHPQFNWWPHHWPLAAQIIVMVLAVDFMRYWLHRASHHYTALWRLHEVHHSPDILYVLNVARFHPLEKVLHFSLDAVPFLLLGVAPEVFAGYFLLYSVNGLFQHSNIRLQYGVLNYLVGSAQTHRWHHARDPKTAHCNFGSTTIIWDLVFGTWYLPKHVAVGDIGITNRSYPKGFFAQMLTPFGHLSPGTWRATTWLANALVHMRLLISCWVQMRQIRGNVKDPMRVQRALLARILQENRNTAFGRQHGFAKLGSYEAFAAQVPVADYEALRPLIEAEIANGEATLTAQSPVCYVRTSGTTGRPKDVPLTLAHCTALRRIQQTAVALQYRSYPQAFSGGILAITSPAVEGLLANGKHYGSASGVVSRNTPALVRSKFVVPIEVMGISDSHVKYLLILRLALTRPDVTYLGTANPSTVLALMKLYREHAQTLINDVRNGTFFLAQQVPTDVLQLVANRLFAQPQRADTLQALQMQGVGPRIADLLPALRLVVCWTCASAGIAADAVRRELAPQTRLLELGYVASEFRGTVTLGRNVGSGLPTLETHFFEFVERDLWDCGEPKFLSLDRLRKGADYHVVVTTPSGLYRYFMNDLVRVNGHFYKTPLLKFLQKGKGATNITGEKLSETQVLGAVRTTMTGYGINANFVMMLADDQTNCYHLYVEPDAGPKPAVTQLASAVDRALATLNIEYAGKRESQRLGPVIAHWLHAGTGDAYKHFCVARGQREGQFKAVALTYRKDFAFDLETHVENV
jgi:sterol desaturase/sphingolipid hydroxylase (fatty acid hydroxylase superfamily)